MLLDDNMRAKSLAHPGSIDHIMITSLKQKLSNQVSRCRMLHEALARQKAEFQTTLQSKWCLTVSDNITLVTDCKAQHQAEVLELQDLVGSTQHLVRQQTSKVMEQVDKLVMSDTIIEQLLVDNDQLTTQLINMKQNVLAQKYDQSLC